MASFILPSDIPQIISERQTLWNQYAQAEGMGQELEKLSGNLANVGPAQLPPALSQPQTPPAELEASLLGLRAEFGKITQSAQHIQACENKIVELETRRRNLIMAGVAALVLVIIIAYCALSR